MQKKNTIKVGSKVFTESYVLAEIVSQILEDAGEVKVERKFGLGATGIAYEAIKAGEVDILPEYTGTISQAILKRPELKSITQLKGGLPSHLFLSPSLGFNNTYALALPKELKNKMGIRKISDLANRSDFKVAFTHEFTKRSDGLKALENHYQFRFQNYKALEHGLAYEALQQKKVDLIEVYSTDAKIKKYDLTLLLDDKDFFPKYLGLLIFYKDFEALYPKSYKALNEKLFQKIDEEKMTELNALVEIDKKSFSEAAAIFLGKSVSQNSNSHLRKIFSLSFDHILLVMISLFFSILLGLPMGIVCLKRPALAQLVLGINGLIQTIPSLALLCFLIPFFGIGELPAFIALILYGLLPIVRNTYEGLKGIDPKLLEAARLLGMDEMIILKKVELPLASPSILAGIKTSAVINVGTATLAAFIGAGGLGNLIVTGLALNDNKMILSGALPAALLAVLFQFSFKTFDRIFIPLALRKLASKNMS